MRVALSSSGVSALLEDLLAPVRHEADGRAAGSIALDELDDVRMLGSGSQGSVMLTIHRRTGDYIAVKRIRLDMADTDEATRKRRELVTEAKTYLQSSCAYVVRSFGVFCVEDTISMLLEYMDAGSLKAVLARGPLPEPALRVITEHMLLGLRYLHETRKLVHRDLKPENVLLSSDGLAKISDFGVSRELADTLANCDTFVGTVTYMSPERLDTMRAVRGYGFAADVWSLGVIVAECALGRYPYPDSVTSQFLAHMDAVCEADAPVDDWLPATSYSPALRSFVSACLSRSQQARPSASALLKHAFVAGNAADAFDFAAWVRDTILFAAA